MMGNEPKKMNQMSTPNYQANQTTPTMAPMSSMSNFGAMSPNYGSPMMSTSSSMPLSNNGLAPLSNQPAIMPAMSMNQAPRMSMMSPMMSQAPMGNMQAAGNKGGGWTLDSPMTPQGHTFNQPTQQQSNGAKKLTAAELADFLN